jgi:hypothetical protein
MLRMNPAARKPIEGGIEIVLATKPQIKAKNIHVKSIITLNLNRFFNGRGSLNRQHCHREE